MSHENALQHRAGGEWDGYRWLYPGLEATPDISRGEQRFIAEVVLAEFKAQAVPTWAHDRAVDALEVLAHG